MPNLTPGYPAATFGLVATPMFQGIPKDAIGLLAVLIFVTLVMFGYVLGDFRHSSAAYITALTIDS
jgi:hypothetical protein